MGFAAGIQSGTESARVILASRSANKVEQAELSKQLRQNLTEVKEKSETAYKGYVEAAARLKERGAEEQQIAPFRQAAQAALANLAQSMEAVNALGASAGMQVGLPGRELVEQGMAQFDALVGTTPNQTEAAIIEGEAELAGEDVRVRGLIDRGVDPEEAQRLVLGTEKPLSERAVEAEALAGASARGAAAATPAFKNFFVSGQGYTTIDTSTPQGRAAARELIGKGAVAVPLSVQASSPGEAGLQTTKAKGSVETDLIGLDDELSVLGDLQKQFDPSFQTLPTELFVKGLNTLERTGVKLSENQRTLVERVSVFKRNAFDVINRTIRRITGAQMSEPEANRIKRQVPDPDRDGPTAFKAKLDDTITQLKLVRARRRIMLERGVLHDFSSTSPPPISIAQTEQIIEARGAELVEQIQAENPGLSDDDAFQMATEQLRAEFFR